MNKVLLIFTMAISLHALEGSHVKVGVVAPQKAEMNIPIEVQGVTEEIAKHIINAPFEGILHTKVAETQEVNKGDIVAILQSQTLTNKKNLLNANLTLYKEQLMVETKKLQSYDEMLKMGLISTNDYLTQQSLVNEKQIILANMKSEFEDLEQLMTKGVIHSPVDGYISDMQTDGSYLTYANPICKVSDANAYIRLYIPAFYTKTLQKGQNILVYLQDSSSVKAVISKVLPSATNNLIEAIAITKTPLPIGLHVQASIQTKNEQGWILPKESIVLIQNRPAVFIIQDHIAHVHFVTIQKDMVDQVFVTDDLNKEQQVATKNAYMLEDSSMVEVTQ